MKKNISTLVLFLFTLSSNAQSDSLKAAYQQVSKTLKEYKFSSQDISNESGKTKYITLIIEKGAFVFTFNDDFRPFHDPFFGYKHGIKTVKVSINDALFDLSYRNAIEIKGENGVEFTYKGKKELLKQYEIRGEELSLKKLQKELLLLNKILEEEGFKGTLNNVTSKKSTPKKNRIPQKKESTKSQTQQRQRNRIPAGN